MHCPRCGTNATAGQQFCRSCGLSLEKVAEILGEEVAVQSSTAPSQSRGLRERQQKFENLAGIAGLTTFGLVLLLFIIIVFTQIILKGGLLIVPGVLLILLALGAGAMAVFQGYSKSLKARLEERPLPPSTGPLSIARTEAIPAQVHSVTERTTALMEGNAHANSTDVSS
jgi:hypothetical protein